MTCTSTPCFIPFGLVGWLVHVHELNLTSLYFFSLQNGVLCVLLNQSFFFFFFFFFFPFLDLVVFWGKMFMLPNSICFFLIKGFQTLISLLDAAMMRSPISIRAKLLWLRRNAMSPSATAGFVLSFLFWFKFWLFFAYVPTFTVHLMRKLVSYQRIMVKLYIYCKGCQPIKNCQIWKFYWILQF